MLLFLLFCIIKNTKIY